VAVFIAVVPSTVELKLVACGSRDAMDTAEAVGETVSEIVGETESETVGNAVVVVVKITISVGGKGVFGDMTTCVTASVSAGVAPTLASTISGLGIISCCSACAIIKPNISTKNRASITPKTTGSDDKYFMPPHEIGPLARSPVALH
jgi:hypothetical protein